MKYINKFFTFLFFVIAMCGALEYVEASEPRIIAIPVDGFENTYRFEAHNLPQLEPLCGEAEPQPDFKYFWRFGSSLSAKKSQTPDGGYSVKKSPIYTFAPSGTYIVLLKMTPIYTSEDPSVIHAYTTITTTSTATNSIAKVQQFDHLDEGKLSIFNNRSPLSGTNQRLPITYVLSYNPVGSDTVSFKFSSNHFSPKENVSNWININSSNIKNMTHIEFNYCGVIFDSIDNLPNDTITLTWAVQETSDNSNDLNFCTTHPTINIFIKLWVNTGITADSLTVNAEVIGGDAPNTSELALKRVKSYDPNQKGVDYDFISQKQQLKYRIDFQNIGDGPATQIIVKDYIHPLLDMNDIQITHLQVGDSTFLESNVAVNKDLVQREFIVTFTGVNLLGTGGLPCAQGEEHTKGYIEYIVYTKNLTTVPSHTLIGDHADIFFDDNKEVSTNKAYTEVYHCCKLAPD